MSRKGDCLDNAVAESFFATLEHELLRDVAFDTRTQALWAVADYIDNFYNTERMHSTIGDQSPIDYELREEVHWAA